MMRAATGAFLMLVLATTAVQSKRLMGGYFVNWAQYRVSPYTYKPEQLKPIVGSMDHLMYAFAKFDDSFNIQYVEYDDATMIPDVIAYKQQNPGLKVLISVGGWTFPSAMFSKMVSTQQNRAAFIASLKQFISKHSFDGVDIDWEYPCSKPRTDMVKITCNQIKQVDDAGGKCPDDTDNFVSLVQELRQALGSMLITVASPAASKDWTHIRLKDMTKYIDYFHVMAYDYTVSDIMDSATTAPNSPLYTPPSDTGAVQWSVNYTISGYLDAGVPPEKMIVGIPLYAHTWFVPGMESTSWQKYGLNATKQDKCCGHFQQTYGAQYGKGSQQCGTYMYSEIMAAGVDYYYDHTTETAIGYMSKDSGDGWTKAGTWFTYNDKNSIAAIAKYINDQNLAGAFVFDTSEDSIDFNSGEFTYDIVNTLHDKLQ